jgi:hypothetical protein
MLGLELGMELGLLLARSVGLLLGSELMLGAYLGLELGTRDGKIDRAGEVVTPGHDVGGLLESSHICVWIQS